MARRLASAASGLLVAAIWLRCSSQTQGVAGNADAGSLDAQLDQADAPDASSSTLVFRKRVLDDQFRAEGVVVFDVNRDGRPDIVTDQFWYESPALTPHAIRPPETFDPEPDYSRSNALFAEDLDHDGYLDVIVVPFPNTEIGWYQNPKGDPNAPWARHVIATHANMETPVYADLFNDGRRQLVMGVELPDQTAAVAWLEPAADPFAPWQQHLISSPGAAVAERYSHGLGSGDLNADGRADVLTSEGWFEAPADRTAGPWPFHAVAFHPNECSQMVVWDVNGDGLADVLSTNSHHYGVWWWEQTQPQNGEPEFVEHLIDDSFSESHALRFDDLDADGVPELITGKRYYSHGKSEPGALDPPLLVYYRRVLDASAPGGARFERHQIDAASGVGTAFEVADVSGDGLPDIVVSNKLGLFYFERDARCAGEPAEWVPLFDGRDLAGWYSWLPSSGRSDPEGVFRVANNEIQVLSIPDTDADKEFGYLATRAEYSNYVVRFDYRWTGRQFNPTRRDGWKLDSGFFVGMVGPDQIWPRAQECQIQVGDSGDIYMFDFATVTTSVADPAAAPPVFAAGGLPYTTPRNANPNWIPTRVVRGAGADTRDGWNHVEITVQGEASKYEINGQLVMQTSGRREPSGDAPGDPSKDLPLLRGRLLIQQEGAEIQFRELYLQGLADPVCAGP